MLNEEKIKRMTRLALYEQNAGKEDLVLSKYYKTDYLTLKMINSAIIMTVGFVLLLVAILFMNAESLLSKMVVTNMLDIGKKLLAIYIIAFAVNMVVTYFVYRHKYNRAKDGLQEYDRQLKELYELYKKEEKNKKTYEKDFEITYIGGEEDDEAFDD